jgi:DNA-binding transcriptional regulator YiaG
MEGGYEHMNAIKEARKRLGISQRALGKKLDIPTRTIEDWERDLHKPPVWAEKLLLEKMKSMEKSGK